MLAAYTDAWWVVGVVERVSSITELGLSGVVGRGEEEAAAAGEESAAGEAGTGSVGGLFSMLNTMRVTAMTENERLVVITCETKGVEERVAARARLCSISFERGDSGVLFSHVLRQLRKGSRRCARYRWGGSL